MKKVLQYGVLSLLLGGLLFSCKKDEKRVFFEGGTAPQLTANQSATIPLTFLTKDNEAVTFSWSNPDYKLTTGLNSQNVTYLWQMDTAGANFTNPKRKEISIANDLSRTFTQSEINDFMLNQLELGVGVPRDLEFRVISSIAGSSQTALVSNVVKLKATPYAIPPKVNPPASGRLFMVGNATPGGWNNPVPVPSQEFTQVSPTLYELTLNISAGNSYLFLPVNGSWDQKYGCLGSNNTNNPDGDDFRPGGGDMLAPAPGGNFKIQVNFQQGKFKLTRL
jgi:hypothetical protein